MDRFFYVDQQAQAGGKLLSVKQGVKARLKMTSLTPQGFA